MKQKLPILFLCLIAFSILLRVIKLIGWQDYFGGDFAFYYFLTKSIVADHKLPLIGHVVGEIGGFAQGVGWNYLLAIPFIMADGHPYGAKVLMFTISSTTVIFGSLLFWRIFGKKEGVAASFFLGTSPNLLSWSNSVWPPYVIPFLTIFYLGFLVLLLTRKGNKYFLFMTTSLGLMVHFEIASFALLLPSYILLSTYLKLHKILKTKDILFALLTYLFLLLPHILYDVSHNFYNIKGIIALLPFDKNNFFTSNFFAILANRIHLFKTDIIVVFSSVSLKVIFLFLLFLLFGAYLYIKDLYIKKWRRTFLIYLLLTILLSWVGLTFLPVKQASFWWITFLSIFYIFSACLILSYLWSKKNMLNKIIIILFVVYFIKTGISEFFLLLQQEFNPKNRKYEIKIQEPVEYVYADSNNKPFKILYVTGGSYVLDYKYLLWYIGKTKYKNSLAFKNLDLRFSRAGGKPIPIYETDQFKNLNPGLYYVFITYESIENGYASKLLSVPTLGKLISAKRLGNNYIVQKRYIE